MKTLWLASWYPDKLSPYNGDFIKRHAEAVSLFEEVQVIAVVRDANGQITEDVLVEEFKQGQLSEKIIYYYSAKRSIPLLDKLASEKKYRKLYKQAVIEYIHTNGKPGLIHVHVGMKAGMIALWAKKKLGVPYIVSEHWSGFLAEAKERFNDLTGYLRLQWKKVVMNASGHTAVSQQLAKSIKKLFSPIEPKVIPNVVNTAVFYPQQGMSGQQQFIHISGLDDLKNPKKILEAFKIVAEKHPLATLKIFGSTRQKIVEYAKELGLNEKVSFQEEVPQSVLAENVNRSLALILYSSYETFGCVIIESNACGVPVIVSDIPVFHETVTENVNGVFAQAGDVFSLAEKMLQTIENRSSFDSNAIAAMTVSKFGYDTIGRQFRDLYREIAQEN